MVDDGAAEAEVQELRMRLYRRDPPSGAVEDYVAAARIPPAADDADATAVEPEPVPRRRYRRWVTAIAVGAGLLAVVALLRTGPPAVVDAPRFDTMIPTAPDVPGALIGEATSADDTALRFDAGGLPVLVAVSCFGSGEIAIALAGEEPMLVPCDDTSPTQALLGSAGRLDAFAVSVVATGDPRWSFAVGAVEPVAQSGTGCPGCPPPAT